MTMRLIPYDPPLASHNSWGELSELHRRSQTEYRGILETDALHVAKPAACATFRVTRELLIRLQRDPAADFVLLDRGD
ncbi:hypothetical protein [Bradyrhizobium brasilense]|uniref:hypothetical protein n=1 Tax=Bradyrhizobium brasilense TaxID=1419277 RepID=UPI001E5FDCA8|nr:hypothetical protein [Bradyrhizobium brasilense]MCC8969141.1 hypothetical protein [Bradyrhizobium brasilense]